jgi:hypothetical protein
MAKNEIDGIHDLAQLYPLKVFPDAVGVESDGRENLLLYGDMVFNAMGPRNEVLARSAARMGPVTPWITERCQRERLRPGGFGDQIYQAADAGEIAPEQAPLLVRSFLSAGVDTTINGIGNALFALAQHPEEYAKLHANPALARPAFEEALRWESTAQTFFRTTGREFTDGSWTVPGLWRPDEVRERLGAVVPDGPAYETTGGFVMAELGRIPTVGDTVDIPGWAITVLAMDGMRADRLRFVPVDPEGEASDPRGSSVQVDAEVDR